MLFRDLARRQSCLKLLHTRIGDAREAEIKFGQLFEIGQMSQTIVIDSRLLEIKMLQLGQLR